MTGNTFGNLFTLTTCGESHGEALMGIVDGCPPGFALSLDALQKAVNRRRPGQSLYTTQRVESDRVEIVSGIFEGKTTGAPIGLIVRNEGPRSVDYDALKNVYRPGHADFTYQHKYGHRDHRGGGRSSARETVLWVAAGAIAAQYLLAQTQLTVEGYVSAIGNIEAEHIDLSIVNSNPFFFPDQNKIPQLEKYIDACRRDKNSIGAKITVIAKQVPIGLGEPVFKKLNAAIAHAMMSIPAVKGVEIGDGFSVVRQKGSDHRDAILSDGFASNHAGGILGGISTGQDIVVHIALKPTSSIAQPIQTVNKDNETETLVVKGRHDPCVGLRAVPIAEAMLGMVLMDYLLLQNRHRQ